MKQTQTSSHLYDEHGVQKKYNDDDGESGGMSSLHKDGMPPQKKQRVISQEQKDRYLVAPTIQFESEKNNGTGNCSDGTVDAIESVNEHKRRKPQSGFRPELDFLFPGSSQFKIDKSQIWYDDEGLRFVTYAESARQLRKWVVRLRDEWCPPSSYSAQSRSSRVIVDGTSGLGGNVIAFGKSDAFDRVVAVELDRVRYECLVHNVSLYRLSKYVDCVHGDFVEWFEKEYSTQCPGAVVFADPPWGGDEYNKVSSIDDLFLYSTSISAANAILGEEEVSRQKHKFPSQSLLKISINRFVEYMLSRGHTTDEEKISVPMVVLKLPINFDVSALRAIPTRHTEVNRSIHRKILFIALIGYRPPLKQLHQQQPVTQSMEHVDEHGVPTVQSLKQFREIWRDTDLKQRLFSLVRGAQLYGCTEQQQRMETLLSDLVKDSIAQPNKYDDQYIYDRLHDFVHESIFQSEEYKRMHPPQQVSDNTFRTNSRITKIHELLRPYLHIWQQMPDSKSRRGKGYGSGGRGGSSSNRRRYDHQSHRGGGTTRRGLLNDPAADMSSMAQDNSTRNEDKLEIRALLDVGCSEGAITAALGQSFKLSREHIHGCDVRDVPTQEGFTFALVNENTGILPYEDGSMSLVTCLMCLHHIRNPENTLREVYRVLEPGGLLVIREHDNTPSTLSMFLDVMHGFYSLVWSKPREMPDFCSEYYARYLSKQQWTDVIIGGGFNFVADDGDIFSKYIFVKRSQSWEYVNAMRQYYAIYQKPNS